MESISSCRKWRLLCITGTEKLVGISGLVFDIDGTLYHHPEYHAAGTREEISEIGRILGYSYNDMESIIATRKQYIALQLNRQATMTETVLSLGITREQWNDLRCRAWQPEQWLTIDKEICRMMMQLKNRYKIAFGTNSPLAIGKQVLRMIGITAIMPNAHIFGSESFGISKPNPDFFSLIALRLELMTSQCLSIGDREEADGTPAIAAGYRDALIVSGNRDALLMATSKLLNDCNMERRYGQRITPIVSV